MSPCFYVYVDSASLHALRVNVYNAYNALSLYTDALLCLRATQPSMPQSATLLPYPLLCCDDLALVAARPGLPRTSYPVHHVCSASSQEGIGLVIRCQRAHG